MSEYRTVRIEQAANGYVVRDERTFGEKRICATRDEVINFLDSELFLHFPKDPQQ